MTEKTGSDNPFNALEPLKEMPVAPATVVAGLALNFALKYHDIATIQDGTLYQQYKLEGRNLRELHLDMVFETAIAMEAHLLGASERIAAMVMDAIELGVEDAEQRHGPDVSKPEGGT